MHHVIVRKIIYKQKIFKTVPKLHRSGYSNKSVPESDYAMLRNAKSTRTTCQTLHASVNMLNVQ